jgi:hypothetical protein
MGLGSGMLALELMSFAEAIQVRLAGKYFVKVAL